MKIKINKSNELLRECTVYAFHVPSINAIKVGFGSDGRARMINYSKLYSLTSSAVSFREWKIPSSSLASTIETACHRALLQADFHRVIHIVDESEARELFNLGHHSYDDAIIVVRDAIEETVNSLYEALGKLKPATNEKAIQKKSEAFKRRSAIKEEKKLKELEEKRKKVETAIAMLDNVVSSYVTACCNAEEDYRKYLYNDGIVRTLVSIIASEASIVYNSKGWLTIKKNIPEIYYATRQVLSCFKRIREMLGLDCLESAVDNINDIRREYDHRDQGYICYLKDYMRNSGSAKEHVLFAVMRATHLNRDNSNKLIKLDKDLMCFVVHTEFDKLL